MPKAKSDAGRAPVSNAEPILGFARAADWYQWLKTNHARSRGVRLQIAKGAAKEGAAKGVSYPEALDAALAWGWIDSRKEALDATAWLQRFTPRTAKSPWSKINVAKAEALITAGKMQAAGAAEVERAKADGRWQRAYDGARTSAVPPDLAAALAANKKAQAFFAKLDGANRYAVLWRVHQAKKPETRAERIKRFVAMCARGERVHPRVG